MPHFDRNKINVIFVLGGPGAGKGTQSDKLVEGFGFVHLSAGDLLREEQKRENSQFGEEIRTCLKEGTIVRMEITIELLKNAMLREIEARQGTRNWSDSKGRFLIDGFPRKMDQALKFEEDVYVATHVLFYDTHEEVLLERLLERGKTSGRTDDNAESIVKRFRVYKEETMPVIDHFEKEGRVSKIDSSGTIEEVYERSAAIVSKLLD